MKHLEDWQIQCFLDGELDPGSRDRVQTHLQSCPRCQDSLQAVQATSWAIRSTKPSPESLRYGSELWQSLTQRLPRRRASTLSWFSLLPPFLLGLLGTSASLLISATHAAYALQRMGIMPPMGSTMVDRMAGVLASPVLEDTVYDRFGWSGDQVSQSLISFWGDVNQSTHHAVGFLACLFLLGVVLSSFVMLYMFWALCLMRADGGVLTGRAGRARFRDGKGG
ncbi:MAG: zf-HC2 domain-containing protein [Anaerolineae bacterium]|nr:zf-HC2 domain-containing protein [Anaerolineae bacterium]